MARVLLPVQSLLHALIGTIERSLSSCTYLYETDRLLQAVKERFAWYEDGLVRLQRVVAEEKHKRLCQKVAEVLLSREYRMVETVKALCEGTTDEIPFALASYINHEYAEWGKRVGRAAGKGDQPIGVALCPYKDFNYIYGDIGGAFADMFEDLDGKIGVYLESYRKEVGALKRPHDPTDRFAMIGYQYALGGDVLYQSVLFHELGHHVYRDLKPRERARLLGKLKELVKPETVLGIQTQLLDTEKLRDLSLTGATDGPHEGRIKLRYNMILDDVLVPWVEELFADAFAVAVSGPQYVLAFCDICEPATQKDRFVAPRQIQGAPHPAELFRRYQQWDTLEAIRWDVKDGAAEAAAKASTEKPSDAGGDFESRAREIIRGLKPTGKLEDMQWRVGDPALSEQEDVLFEKLIPLLRGELEEMTKLALKSVPDAKKRRQEFWDLGGHVKTMFDNAIVPSTIVLNEDEEKEAPTGSGNTVAALLGVEDRAADNARVYHPQPCTVMNVARLIYEDGCGALMKYFSPDLPPNKRVFHVHSRLSDWAQKAVADWLIMKGRRTCSKES